MNISQMMKENPKYLVAEIKVLKRGKQSFYIDERTEPTMTGQMPKVKPIAWNWMYLWIVCRFCQRIHKYPILEVRRKKDIIYSTCKGRNKLNIEQSPIQIDESEMKVVI